MTDAHATAAAIVADMRGRAIVSVEDARHLQSAVVNQLKADGWVVVGGKSALNTRMHATFQFDVVGGHVKELAEAARLAMGHLLAPGQTFEDDVTWELDDIRIDIATTTGNGERTIRIWAAVVRGSIVVPGV